MPEPLGPSKSNFHLAADPALSRVRTEMEALVRNSIRLWPQPGSDDDIPIGASKLGGMPDLQPDLAWPTFKIVKKLYRERALPKDGIISLPFIGQFNLEQLAQYDADHVLPKTGMLYLFFFDFLYADGDDGWMFEPGKIRALHHHVDIELLTRQELPTNLPGDRSGNSEKVEVYTPCRLQFTSERMLPPGGGLLGP